MLVFEDNFYTASKDVASAALFLPDEVEKITWISCVSVTNESLACTSLSEVLPQRTHIMISNKCILTPTQQTHTHTQRTQKFKDHKPHKKRMCRKLSLWWPTL